MRKTTVRSFSIFPELLRELEKTAAEESRNHSELVREAIRQYLRAKRIDELNLRILSEERRPSTLPTASEQRTSVAGHARRAADMSTPLRRRRG